MGKMKLVTGEMIIFSGKVDKHEGGVAVIMVKFSENCILEWNLVSDRILRVRFESRFAKTTLIVCHAPTNNATDEGKENF
jgi:hypothetical protein